MKKSEIIFVVLISAILWCIKGQAQYLPEATTTRDITISTRDAQNFVKVFNEAVTRKTIKEFYLGNASIAMDEKVMRTFVQKLNKFTKSVKTDYQTFKGVENKLNKLVEEEVELKAALQSWTSLYPKAMIPDVYFAVGQADKKQAFNHGNLVINLAGLSPNGIDPHAYEGVKLYPQVLRAVIATEFDNCMLSENNLAKAIREGSLDFLVELTTGINPNAEIFRYAATKEQEITSVFKDQMNYNNTSTWYSINERKSKKLARWIGYRIVSEYYQNAKDKTQAIETILNVRNYDCFYNQSYGNVILTSSH